MVGIELSGLAKTWHIHRQFLCTKVAATIWQRDHCAGRLVYKAQSICQVFAVIFRLENHNVCYYIMSILMIIKIELLELHWQHRYHLWSGPVLVSKFGYWVFTSQKIKSKGIAFRFMRRGTKGVTRRLVLVSSFWREGGWVAQYFTSAVKGITSI